MDFAAKILSSNESGLPIREDTRLVLVPYCGPRYMAAIHLVPAGLTTDNGTSAKTTVPKSALAKGALF